MSYIHRLGQVVVDHITQSSSLSRCFAVVGIDSFGLSAQALVPAVRFWHTRSWLELRMSRNIVLVEAMGRGKVCYTNKQAI
uniref:Polyketide synthase n=1 Tax=Peronospora matthiolae TaxID=2874970 RepID=A0AAV1ULY2_9STRA